MPETPSDGRKSKRRILATGEELFAARGGGPVGKLQARPDLSQFPNDAAAHQEVASDRQVVKDTDRAPDDPGKTPQGIVRLKATSAADLPAIEYCRSDFLIDTHTCALLILAATGGVILALFGGARGVAKSKRDEENRIPDSPNSQNQH